MSQAQLLPTVSPAASPFQFKGFSIRTQVEDNQLWFVAKDVCAALDIDWSGKTLAVIPDSWQSMGKVPTLCRGMQRVKRISEPAVYKLAFRSNKPEADAFTNWVASEVLPAIRKTGKYESVPKKKALGRGIKALPPTAKQPSYRSYAEVKSSLGGIQGAMMDAFFPLKKSLENINYRTHQTFNNPQRRDQIATETDIALKHLIRALSNASSAIEESVLSCNETLSGLIELAAVLENPQQASKPVRFGVQVF